MNLINQQIRALTYSISIYERMEMDARLNYNRVKADEFKNKAQRCRDELNYLLRTVDDG